MAAGFGGAMSWGGCLDTGCLATLSGGCVPLGRRLPAKGDCRVTLACFVAPADAFEALLTMDGDRTTTGLAFALDGLSSAAAVAPGDFGAVGCTTVGRTSLGFRDGLDSADGGFFTAARPAFALGDLSSAAAVAPGDFGAVGCTRVGRTSLGFRDGFGSADGGFFATTEAALVLGDLSSAAVTPGDFGAVG